MMLSFKQEVLQMIYNGRPVSEVAQSLGIGENIIYRWKSTARQQQQPDGQPVADKAAAVFLVGVPPPGTLLLKRCSLYTNVSSNWSRKEIF